MDDRIDTHTLLMHALIDRFVARWEYRAEKLHKDKI